MKKFTRDDIKNGYVVKLRNGELRMTVEVGTRGALVLVDTTDKFNYLSHWEQNLTAYHYNFGYSIREKARQFDIVEVYGHVNDSDYYGKAGYLSTYHRPLLWSRDETKKMTISEIEKKLGHKVEIIAE